MAKLFANSGDPDQMPHYVASDLGLQNLLLQNQESVEAKSWYIASGTQGLRFEKLNFQYFPHTNA